MPKKIYKVIQWSSGNVGKASIRVLKIGVILILLDL